MQNLVCLAAIFTLATVRAQISPTDCSVKSTSTGEFYGTCCGSTAAPPTGPVDNSYDAAAAATALASTIGVNNGLYNLVSGSDTGSLKIDPTVSEVCGAQIGQPTGIVSNCGEACFSCTPNWVFIGGQWRRVVQLPQFTQNMRICWCNNQVCSGQSSCGWWWSGKCRREVSWRLLLIWSQPLGGLTWVRTRYDNGCCCVPWGYA